MKPVVSVIVPTRNGARRLPALLGALARQTAPAESFEVLVADDCSTDDTVEVVERSGVARAVRAERHLGQAGASNLALGRARGELIAFTDDDTVPAVDWIERGIGRLQRGEVDIVGGHVELTVSDPPSLAELVDIGRGYLDQRAMVEREGYAATANLWIRRDLVERVGGFRQIWSGQDQDRDLVERAVAAGARLAYAPDVVVEHPARATLKELARKEYRLAKGAVEVRRLSVGTAAGQPQPWTRPKLYLPWRHQESALRLERRGVRLRGFRRLQLRAAQYVCLQLLQAAGSAAGDVRFRRRSAH